MLRWTLFAASALILGLPAGAQDAQKKFDVEIKKVDVRGSSGDWNVTLTAETTFPGDAVLCFLPKARRHFYNWQSKEFLFGADFNYGVFDQVVPKATNHTVSGKKFKVDKIPVPTPGIYEVSVWFDPAAQIKGDSVKKAMGRSNYYRYDFEATVVWVGDSKKMMQELMDDTDDCAKMIKKIMQLLERIERESDDADWVEKSQKIFDEIGKLRVKAGQQAVKSLHNATYKLIDEVLYEVIQIGNAIKLLKQAEAAPGGGGGGGGGEEEPETEHNENGGDTPILGGLDGTKLTLSKTKEHIRICDAVRMREYWSWETLLFVDSMKKLNDTYAAAKADGKEVEAFRKVRGDAVRTIEDTERAYKHVTSDEVQKDAFLAITKYVVEEKEQPFGDFFKMYETYVAALLDDAQKGAGEVPQSVKDLQALVKLHLDAARAKAMGMKKKKSP